jgi:hypothetical protein
MPRRARPFRWSTTAASLLLAVGWALPSPALAAVTADPRAQAHGAALRADGGGASLRWAPPVKGPCGDGAYTLFPAAWDGSYRWRFKWSSVPEDLDPAKVLAALRRAASNVVNADNDCGDPDLVSARHRYDGVTFRGPNISNGSACGQRDGVSVVAFGDLAPTDLGMSCWWSLDGRTVEADIKLNRVEYGWVLGISAGCHLRWSVEAVATHEFGHAFGLDHVSEVAHRELTMSPLISPCQSQERTLGRGDLLGLQARY